MRPTIAATVADREPHHRPAGRTVRRSPSSARASSTSALGELDELAADLTDQRLDRPPAVLRAHRPPSSRSAYRCIVSSLSVRPASSCGWPSKRAVELQRLAIDDLPLVVLDGKRLDGAGDRPEARGGHWIVAPFFSASDLPQARDPTLDVLRARIGCLPDREITHALHDQSLRRGECVWPAPDEKATRVEGQHELAALEVREIGRDPGLEGVVIHGAEHTKRRGQPPGGGASPYRSAVFLENGRDPMRDPLVRGGVGEHGDLHVLPAPGRGQHPQDGNGDEGDQERRRKARGDREAAHEPGRPGLVAAG